MNLEEKKRKDLKAQELLKHKYSEAQALFERNKALLAKGNQESQIKANRDHIWLILYEIISMPHLKLADSSKIGLEQSDLYMDKDIKTIKYIIENYDSNMGNLEHFVNHTWNKRKNTTDRERERKEINPLSINRELDTEKPDKETIADIIPDQQESEETKIHLTEENLENIIAIVTGINHLKKDDRRKLVFTDNITELCKNEIEDVETPTLLNRQQSIIEGMNLQFLDFYMREMCRTLRHIQQSGLKSWKTLREWEENYFKHIYGRDGYKRIITKERDQEELELPLSNKVYTCFLLSEDRSKTRESVEVSVSQYKDRYKTFLKVLGLQNIIRITSSNLEEQTDRGAEGKTVLVSPIRDIILEKISELNNQSIEKAAKKLYEKINDCMEDKCRQIIQCYQYILREKETDQNKEYDQQYRKWYQFYLTDFLKDWRENFSNKYLAYKNKKETENYVSDDIKKEILPEIRKIIEDEEQIKVILKSLDYEFGVHKQITTGLTICDTIERKIFHQREKEILDRIEANIQADRRLIRDTICVCEKTKSTSIKIIVNKIQDDNLYHYFWC
jgi:hypothetical protein